ncbi:MAG: hypothetical protein ACFFBP_09325 [Promethearchaeota archaeon]
MPLGLMVMKWEEKTALEKKAQYPENKELFITGKTFMHLLNLHGFSKEAGMTTLNVKDINIVTYYSGVELNYYVILVLNLLENAEDYEEIFEKGAIEILEHINNDEYKKMLPPLFEKLSLKSTNI